MGQVSEQSNIERDKEKVWWNQRFMDQTTPQNIVVVITPLHSTTKKSPFTQRVRYCMKYRSFFQPLSYCISFSMDHKGTVLFQPWYFTTNIYFFKFYLKHYFSNWNEMTIFEVLIKWWLIYLYFIHSSDPDSNFFVVIIVLSPNYEYSYHNYRAALVWNGTWPAS